VAAPQNWNVRRTLIDLLLSACAMTVLFTTLVAFDARVREEVTLALRGAPQSAEIVAARTQARGFVSVVAAVARDQSQQHAPLMIFLGAATVLTIFMVRT